MFLILLALIGVGLAADDDGDVDIVDENGDESDDDFDFGAGDDDDGDGDGSCDEVVVVQSASGTADVPGGRTVTESSVECQIVEGEGDEDAVRALQEALVRCNGQQIAVDGVYGQQTREAISRVEAQHGLAVDGVYGPAVRDAMSWPVTSESGTQTCVSVSSATASVSDPK